MVAGLVGGVGQAHAAMPTLTLTASGGGDIVSVTARGDASANVILNYQKINYGAYSQYLGTTDSSGYFSTTMSMAGYGIVGGTTARVTVNGQNSIDVAWPYGGTSGSTITLSPSSLFLSLGQSSTITVNNNSGYGISIPANSNPSVANGVINGNQVTVNASAYGSTSMTICSTQYTSNCATLAVSVAVSGNQSAPTLSQTNLSLAVGQSGTVTISGGSAPYTMYYNGANSNYFSGVISGNSLMVLANSIGTSSMSVCSAGGTPCTTLTVAVSSTTTNSLISFSPSTLNVNVGATTTANIYGGYTFYVSSHSNTSVASAYVNGSVVTVTGLNAGSDNITICLYGSQCGTLYVVVGGGTTTQTAITFSNANPAVAVGQTTTVSVYGGTTGSYYIPYTSNSSSVQTSMSGSTLTITGITSGNTVIVVCSSLTNCAAVTATIGATSTGGNGNWFYCATEGSICYFSGTKTVQYGANGAYYYRTATSSAKCNNATFGDPIFGVQKRCYIGGL